MFIAEIGINHNGDLYEAKKLIKMCKDAGVNVVKFQKRTPDLCVPKEKKEEMKHTPWGEMTYLDYKKRIEFEREEYDEIDKYCKELKIQWTASVWDIKSLFFISQYDVPFIKIASACITDTMLLTEINKLRKPVIISIGMSTEEEMANAMEILSDCEVAILHCNSSYPANDDELDLAYIDELKVKHPTRKIGYSGHELGIGACITAKAMGAEIIERHVTLDKNMWGTDQSASLEYDELKEMINIINKVDIWVGKPRLKVYDSEKKVKEKLRMY